MRRGLRFVAITALFSAASVGAGQSSQLNLPLGTGSIRGRVIEVGSGAPIAGATVTIFLQANRASRSATSDADGRFTLEQVPAGSFDFSAFIRTGGYYGGRYGQRTPFSASQPFELAEGEQVSAVELPLWQTATLYASVVDSSNQPVSGVTVQMLMLGIEQGVRHLRAAGSARTDATGKCVVRNIVPTTYAVAIVSPIADVETQGGRASQAFAGYPTTFYPSSVSADGATLMTIGAGELRRDVNFTLPTAAMVSVAGTVAGLPADARAPVLEMLSAQRVAPTTNVPVARATIRPDGQFRFPKVLPGSYLLRSIVFPAAGPAAGFRTITQTVSAGGFSFMSLQADPSLPLAPVPVTPTMWASVPVTVGDRDLAGVTIRLRPGGRIIGQVAFTGTTQKPAAEGLLATPIVVAGVHAQELKEFPMTRVEADGHFKTVGLPPGTYSLMALTGSQFNARWDAVWKPEPTRVAGRETTGGAIEVGDADVTGVTLTFSDSVRATELSGVVREASGRVRADATVYLFPVDQDLWPRTGAVREVRPGRSGRYTVSGLPPLEYFVVAAMDEVGELWREQAYLAKLSATATRVTLAAGDKKTVDLTVR